MTDGAGVETWSTDAWRAVAIAWIDHQLEAAGVRRTGETEQPRIRPWATVLKVPTTEGTFWLKVAAPETAFEVALYPLLHHHVPDAVLPVLAVDVERGWLLLPDGGVHLGDAVEGTELVEAMVTVLPRYAELQRSLAPKVDAMLSVGVVDMRPVVMPQRFEEALSVTGECVEGHGSQEHRATWKRIEAMRGTVLARCDRLTASPVPPSLDHNNLHPWNVLVPGAAAVGQARFYDWGDSVIAHPFASMLVALRFMQDHLKVRLDDMRLLRVRDAYLEVFSDLGSRAELVETLELACRLGSISRAIVWVRVLAMQPEDGDRPFAGAPLSWLAELLDGSYLGSTGY